MNAQVQDLRVYDEGVDFSQGLDLDHTEAAVKVKSISVSHSVWNLKMNLRMVCEYWPLVGVDHKPVKVCVFLDDAQGNHVRHVSVCVLQLVQFQVDSEHVFPDSVWTGLQTTTHDVPAEGNEWEKVHRFCVNSLF